MLITLFHRPELKTPVYVGLSPELNCVACIIWGICGALTPVTVVTLLVHFVMHENENIKI